MIVCPAFLKGTWSREVQKFSDLVPVILNNRTNFEFDVAIVSYSMLGKVEDLFKKAAIVIADEVHYLKNIDAKRTQLFHNYLEKYRPERFIGLTGTPILNRVPEFFSLLMLCSYNKKRTSGIDLRQYGKTGDYWRFCDHFAHRKTFKVHGRRVVKYEGHKNTDQLRELMKGKYLRRKASDVLDLPPITRKDVILNNEAIDEDLWIAYQKEGEKAFVTHKVDSAMLKVKSTIKYAKDLMEQGEGPLIIYTDHVKPAHEIAKGIKGTTAVITGQVPMKVRDDIVVRFQEGEVDVLIATIGALSEGVTLTRSKNIIFNDLAWVPGKLAQCEKRIHRIGQEHHCTIHRMFWGKIDVKIGKELDKKIKTLIEVL